MASPNSTDNSESASRANQPSGSPGTGCSTASAKPFGIGTHNGIITITNPATGEHRTVKVSMWKKSGKRIASLLVGPNNESDYVGFGFVGVDGKIHLFRKNQDGFFYKLAAILEEPERFAGRLEFTFEGRCRRCNRLLTTPESVAKGIGPECEKRYERR